MKNELTSWLRLGLALIGVAAFITVLHLLSPRLPGTAGDIFRSNVDKDIEATALFYSESGDIREYIDGRNGKYAAPLDR